MPFITLPTELLHVVGKNLPPSALLSLLRTSQQLNIIYNPLLQTALIEHKDIALLWSATRNRPKLAKTLIEAGADINARHPTFIGHPSVLELAVENGCTEIVKVLIDKKVSTALKPDPRFRGDAVVRKAVDIQNYEMTKMLLEYGASPNDPPAGSITRLFDETALHTAVRTNNPAMVELLIEHGAEIFARDYKHRTPLEAAHDMARARKNKSQCDLCGEEKGPEEEELYLEVVEVLVKAGEEAADRGEWVEDGLSFERARRMLEEFVENVKRLPISLAAMAGRDGE